MTQPDRTKQPEIKTIDTFQSVYADKTQLSNDIPLRLIQSGTEDIVKVDLLFRAGNWYQPKPLVAEATNEMLPEGTNNLTSAQIANKLDYYGAFLQTNANNDVAIITLLTLNKHLNKTLSILAEIVQNPIFPENEFQTYIRNKKQHFLLERSKVNSQSRIKFKEALFGPNHPYGKILVLEDHNNVTTEDLKNFHNTYYRPKNCEILVTGNLKADVVSQIDHYLGNTGWKKDEYPKIPTFEIQPTAHQEIFTPKEDAVQSAIRMGKVLFNQHHKDFMEMQVVNTILGGYFGSRLMKTIREKKGYTYGISSLLIPLVHAGYFVIVSEVGAKVCGKAIEAIQQEIRRFKEDKTDEEELNMVKNYMRGEILKYFDGPLPTASTYLRLMEHNLTEDYHKLLLQTINDIQPERIRELAEKYLDEEDMKISIAGQCEK